MIKVARNLNRNAGWHAGVSVKFKNLFFIDSTESKPSLKYLARKFVSLFSRTHIVAPTVK